MSLGEVHVPAHFGGTTNPENPFEISTFVAHCGAVAQPSVFSHGIRCPQPDTC